MNLIRNFETTARKITPRWLLVGLKRFYIFNKLYGQLQTRQGLLVDGQGNHIPWFTYPAIEFLKNLDFHQDRIFEFGSGASSLFWLSRAKDVTSVEHDPKWFESIGTLGSQHVTQGRWKLYFEKDDQEYARMIHLAQAKFDVIAIDGAARRKCAEEAVKAIADNGIIILDNSEWYPSTCRFLRDKGFAQIDFAGFAPQNAFTHCTSIFCASTSSISSRFKDKTMEWAPIGGRTLLPHGAYDDEN